MLTRRQFLKQSSAAAVAAVALSPLSTIAARRPSGIVHTVLGPIDASRLGFTLPHEHVCASSAGFWRAWPEYFGKRASFIAKAVDKLKAVKAEGVDSIVDVTPFDVGRDVRLLEEISRKSGVQIVTCTGHWLDPSLSMQSLSLDELTEFFTLEAERGIEDTGIKPGVIKIAAAEEGLTPFLEKSARAAARAGKATGLPIIAHTHAPNRTGKKQAELFEAEGLNPARVCLGHSDDTDDVEYLLGLASRGYMVGMDHLGWGVLGRGLPWQQRADFIRKLIDAGYAKQLLLSNDWMLGQSTYSARFMQFMDQKNPDGMLFLARKIIPYLKQHGVPDELIRTITVENPQRFLGGLE